MIISNLITNLNTLSQGGCFVQMTNCLSKGKATGTHVFYLSMSESLPLTLGPRSMGAVFDAHLFCIA